MHERLTLQRSESLFVETDVILDHGCIPEGLSLYFVPPVSPVIVFFVMLIQIFFFMIMTVCLCKGVPTSSPVSGALVAPAGRRHGLATAGPAQ